MTAEEIENLPEGRLEEFEEWKETEEYELWLEANGEEAPEKQESNEGAEKAGAKYFKENPECPVNSILVAKDGAVFYNTLRGKNAAENHGAPYTEVNK